MKSLRYFLALALISSCGHSPEKRNLDEVTPYQTSGVEQYFLPEMPAWANFSAKGSCFKSSSFHYLDFAKLAATYQLNYHQLSELQAQYNDRLEDYFRSTTKRFLKPVEEASFFSNTLEQVRGGVKKLNIPQMVKVVDVIWLEGYVQANKVPELVQLMKSERFNENFPLIFSSCLSRQNLDLWIKEHKLDEVGLHLVSAEWLSAFGSDLKSRAGLTLEIQEIVGPNIKVNIIAPTGMASSSELILPKETAHVRRNETRKI